MSASQAHILIRYPLNHIQTASLTTPDQVAPGLGWDFLTPSYEGGLDYGSPNGFLRNRAPGGYLAKKWPSSNTPDPSKYFEFSIQPREHCVAQLEGISMAVLSTALSTSEYYGHNARALSPQRWEVRLSLNTNPGQEWTVFSKSTPVSANGADSIHLFENDGDFSTAPLIPERTTATFRIYGYEANPLVFGQEAVTEIHAIGGLIHTTLGDAVLGQDLMLHGSVHCKKETHRYLISVNADNPLLEALKLGNVPHLADAGSDLASLAMIPEPRASYWVLGLLSLAITRFTRKRNNL